MAHHDQVARLFSQRRVLRQPGLTVDAGHERKHCDGLLRQYLPEGTDLRVHDALDLGVIETTEHQTPQDFGREDARGSLRAGNMIDLIVATIARIRPPIWGLYSYQPLSTTSLNCAPADSASPEYASGMFRLW